MNKSEAIVLTRLKSLGYNGILFHASKTPDFTTEQGDSFEVKTLENNGISFADNQFKTLCTMPDTVIIVVEGNNILTMFPFSNIKEGQESWNNLKIRRQPQTVRICSPTIKRLEFYRVFHRETMNDLINTVLDKADQCK